MSWGSPLLLFLKPSADGESFRTMARDCTALPLAPHPGAYGVVRKNHTHEGVDLYCAPGMSVHAVEDGEVVAVLPFTGPKAGSPWWHDTQAVLVEGKTGVVVYGEIAPSSMAVVGKKIQSGMIVGHVVPVLKVDKGRPMSMLHLELHAHGTRDVYEWKKGAPAPKSLRDPTPYLLPICKP